MRHLEGFQRNAVNFIAVGFALFFIYGIIVTLPFYILSPLYICLSLVLVFCLYPATKRSPKNKFSVYDLILCVLITAVTIFFFKEYEWYVDKAGPSRTKDIIMGTVALLVNFEACRRVLGWPLPILFLVALMYVLFGYVVPGSLGHIGFDYERAIGQIFSFDGIYGEVCSVFSTYVLLFVIFGAVIQSCGISNFLINLSKCLVGRLKGGTAKTAIVSSGIIGSVIGSGAANVAITGSFTIPIMKKAGYPPHIAGAIETVASSGGILMPPIMGSAAFILVDIYQHFIPGCHPYILSTCTSFFLGVYIQAHFISYKLDIAQTTDTGSLASVLKEGGHMLVPVLLIFILIVIGMTPYRAGIWAIVVTLLVHFLKPIDGKRLSFKEVINTFGEGIKLQLSVAASTGIIGAIIAMLVLPGLPLKVASFAVELSQGSLFIMLILMIITSYIFGMGIPMVAAYIILAVIAVPALIELGVPLFTAHLIIMWYSLDSCWTPPVAIGAFVASGIAKASPNKIGWYSVKLGISLYVIPFLMAYGYIINGAIPQILLSAACIAIALYCFAAATEGFTKRKLIFMEIVIYGIAAVLLIVPLTLTRISGFALFGILFFRENKSAILQKFEIFNKKSESEP